VHVLPHHHLELEAHTGVTVDADDLEDLHHHLNDLERRQKEAS
jgi:tetrahydromethanopterin S-methyltransferase subunit G